MRVGQFTTSIEGGAGKAAVRLHNALVEAGVDSTLVSINGKGNLSNSHYAINRTRSEILSSKGLTLFQSRVISNSNSYLTPASVSLRAALKQSWGEFDVLHFHNIYNLISRSEILQISKLKPVFVTLHDYRFFSGGCHYPGTCSQFKDGCTACPQARSIFRSGIRTRHDRDMQLVSGSQLLSLISPSQWLLRQAKLNPFFKDTPGFVVKNPIPTCLNAAPLRFGKADEIRIGFCASNLSNPIKGLDQLVNALQLLRRSYLLVLIGSCPPLMIKRLPHVLHLPDLNPSELEKSLSTLDVLVVPSREENYPNVIGEALQVGTKVIGANVGGIPEILSAFDLETFDDLSDLVRILDYFDVNYDKTSISRKANEFFSPQIIARQVLDLYQDRIH